MKWSAEDIAFYLEAQGDVVKIRGKSTHAIVTTREQVADGMGGMVVIDSPKAVVATSDMTAFVTVGEDGDKLVIDGTYYRILSSVDNGDGLSELRLALL